jgi:hypothetical protein
MANARLKSDILKVIEEDELPKMYDDGILNKEDFICSGCFAKAIPCSYQPTNLVRPYFRIDEHDEDCYIIKYNELVKTGKKKKVSTSSGFPLPYPSNLYLQEKIIKVIDKDSDNETSSIKTITSYTQNTDKTEASTSHHRTSSTIRPIVKHFISFPYDRDISLNLPMIDSATNTYRKIFKKILQWDFNLEKWKDKYSTLKLYYAILSVEKDNIIETDTSISLKLLFIGYTPINFVINTTNWSKRKKTEIINELKELSEQKRKSYNPEVKSKKNIYLFFIGNLDINNPKQFNLYNDDYRLYFAKFYDTSHGK